MNTRMIFVITTLVAVALFWIRLLANPATIPPVTVRSNFAGAAGMFAGCLFWLVTIASHVWVAVKLIHWAKNERCVDKTN